MGEGKNDQATEAVAIAVVKPDFSGVVDVVREAVNLAGETIGIVNPEAGLALKTLAVTGGWLWNARKYDRVKPALAAIAARLERDSAGYVKKEEFADLLEDVLRRIADQPDSERRGALRSILENVMDKPVDHVAHRRFLRLADELPVPAWKLLAAVEQAGAASPGELIEGKENLLMRHTALTRGELEETMEYLANEGILDRKKFNVGLQRVGPGALKLLLTRTGADFVEYKRG